MAAGSVPAVWAYSGGKTKSTMSMVDASGAMSWLQSPFSSVVTVKVAPFHHN